jgi:hypothetical protein
MNEDIQNTLIAMGLAAPMSGPAVGPVGMMTPNHAQAPGGDFMRMLENQQGQLGGPVPSSKDIDAMILEQGMTDSPAAPKEYYAGLEPEMGGMPMIQKTSTGKKKASNSASKKTGGKPQKTSVDEVTEEFMPQKMPGSAPRGYQGSAAMDQFMNKPVSAEFDIDPDSLINEMTKQKANESGFYRGQLPKNQKKSGY